MKNIFLALFGFIVALASFTLASPYGYHALGFVYAIVLFYLFFGTATSAGAFLIGFTVGIELLGTHRPGAALLTSTALYGLYLLLAVKVRFTSPYLQFIVAMLVSLLCFAVIPYSVTGLTQRLIGLAVIATLISVAGALARRVSEQTHHGIV
jgi:hypothetical protein